MSFELTTEKYNDLKLRAINYLRVLGVDADEIDECLSRSFVKLTTTMNREDILARSEEERMEIVNNFWKVMVKQSVTDNQRQTRRMRVVLENGDTEDIAIEVDNADFTHKVLNGVYDALSDDDIIVLLALVDCNLSMAECADYLGEQRTNMYHIIKRIRAKVAVYFPEKTSDRSKGVAQTTVAKRGEWGRFLMAVERVQYDEWHPVLFDKATEKRAIEGTVTAHAPGVFTGTVPGTTPTVISLTMSQVEALRVVRGLDITSAKFTTDV